MYVYLYKHTRIYTYIQAHLCMWVCVYACVSLYNVTCIYVFRDDRPVMNKQLVCFPSWYSFVVHGLLCRV